MSREGRESERPHDEQEDRPGENAEQRECEESGERGDDRDTAEDDGEADGGEPAERRTTQNRKPTCVAVSDGGADGESPTGQATEGNDNGDGGASAGSEGCSVCPSASVSKASPAERALSMQYVVRIDFRGTGWSPRSVQVSRSVHLRPDPPDRLGDDVDPDIEGRLVDVETRRVMSGGVARPDPDVRRDPAGFLDSFHQE